ncbi:unnamed protein product [Closterium sp. Yama58-4]|nr:unnamed protein product [Closterium sp. Yama58-4]
MAVHRGSRRGLLALVAAIACFCCLPCTSLAQPIAESQGEVLQELQKSWNTNISSWQAGSDCQQAQGLTCDSDGMITSMRLDTPSAANFSAVTSVTRLSALTQLEVSQVPHIPQGSLYNLTWLMSLAVDCSPYNGDPIPDGVANLTQLTRLRIGNCGFGDYQLDKVTRITNLLELELPSTNIWYTGNITSTKFPRLLKLDLSSNQIQSYNTVYLKTLTGLTSLDLAHNKLSGDQVLPDITFPTLRFLNLSNNQLNGTLPEYLTSMTNLVGLNVASNYMEGTIPPALGKLDNLSALDTNTSGLRCPDSYSSCGVPQNASSGFCRACPDFCATCDKRKPLPWWAIAGIVAGVVLTVALAILLYFYCFTNRHHVAANSFDIPSDEEAGQQLHILSWVQQQLAQFGRSEAVASLKDPRMEARDELVLRVVQLALRCTAMPSAMRPTMGVIAAELEAVLVELGGARSNSAAHQVDQQMEEHSMSALSFDLGGRLNLPAMAVHRGSRHSLLALVAALICCCLPCTSLAVPIADSQGKVLQDMEHKHSKLAGGERLPASARPHMRLRRHDHLHAFRSTSESGFSHSQCHAPNQPHGAEP